MTSSIPDAFSPEELQRMLAEAQPEPEAVQATANRQPQSQQPTPPDLTKRAGAGQQG